METFIVNAKDKAEFNFLSDLFKKMKIQAKVLSLDEKEDITIGREMKLSRKSGKGNAEKVMAHINSHL